MDQVFQLCTPQEVTMACSDNWVHPSFVFSCSTGRNKRSDSSSNSMIVYISITVYNYNENIYTFPGSTVAQLEQIEMQEQHKNFTCELNMKDSCTELHSRCKIQRTNVSVWAIWQHTDNVWK